MRASGNMVGLNHFLYRDHLTLLPVTTRRAPASASRFLEIPANDLSKNIIEDEKLQENNYPFHHEKSQKAAT